MKTKALHFTTEIRGKQLGNWEDPPEEGMATHFSTLTWRILMDRGSWWATVHEVPESDMTEWPRATHSTAW